MEPTPSLVHAQVSTFGVVMDLPNMDALEEIFNVPFTFSKNCRSGMLDNCGCWRCRKERGEEVTEETEKQAAEAAEQADAEFARSQQEWYEKYHGKA